MFFMQVIALLLVPWSDNLSQQFEGHNSKGITKMVMKQRMELHYDSRAGMI